MSHGAEAQPVRVILGRDGEHVLKWEEPGTPNTAPCQASGRPDHGGTHGHTSVHTPQHTRTRVNTCVHMSPCVTVHSTGVNTRVRPHIDTYITARVNACARLPHAGTHHECTCVFVHIHAYAITETLCSTPIHADTQHLSVCACFSRWPHAGVHGACQHTLPCHQSACTAGTRVHTQEARGTNLSAAKRGTKITNARGD